MPACQTALNPLLQIRQDQAYWVERIEKQLEFAGELLALYPQRQEAWQPLLVQARQEAARRGDPRTLCAAIEHILAPFVELAKSYTITCVGHAHIDMNWMWSWPETVQVVNDTFSTVLALLEEFPDFCFSQSQAAIYHIVETYNPSMLKKITEWIRKGRWEVTASHWVEGDKNLAGSEALCRHLLYTRNYMQKLFDLSPEDVPVDWSPDTFGHAATIPAYLSRGGVKYLYLHRPGVHTEGKPELFWWEGPDGSRVLVRNDMRRGYNGRIDGCLGHYCMEYARLAGLRHFMFVYGVGDHGGGPTRRDLERAVDLATWPVYPAVRLGTAKQFFEDIAKEEQIPVVRGELNTEFAGCYTSQSLIKRSNRYSEARLDDAEFAAVFAVLAANGAYPAEHLESSWRDTLFSHFHDILPGSGVHDTRTYAHGKFQEIMAKTSMIETTALRRLAGMVDTAFLAGEQVPGIEEPAAYRRTGQSGGAGVWCTEGSVSCAEIHHRQGDRPFVVFNTTSCARAEVLEVTLWDHAPAEPCVPFKQTEYVVVCPDGAIIAAQKTEDGGAWGHDFIKVCFPVKIPPLGYATYLIRESAQPASAATVKHLGLAHHCVYAAIERNEFGLENGRTRVVLDPHTGGIRQLVDLASGAILIDEPHKAVTLEYGVERPHNMSAWLIEHMGETIAPQVVAMQRKNIGPHRVSVQVNVKFGQDSEFTLLYELRADDPKLYLTIRGRWGERGSMQTGIPALRLRLPFALQNTCARYEIPFGALDRELRREEEVPALRWAQVEGTQSGMSCGCLLVNDCKHGHALADNTLYLSLIRASYDPDPIPEIGMHEIRLALQPHTGVLSAAKATSVARALNHPLRAIGTPVHAGTLPVEACGMRLEGAGLILCGLKKAEADDGVIVRLYECDGNVAAGRLLIDPTVWGTVTEAHATDLLERPQNQTQISVTGNQIGFQLPAHAILTLHLNVTRLNTFSE